MDNYVKRVLQNKTGKRRKFERDIELMEKDRLITLMADKKKIETDKEEPLRELKEGLKNNIENSENEMSNYSGQSSSEEDEINHYTTLKSDDEDNGEINNSNENIKNDELENKNIENNIIKDDIKEKKKSNVSPEEINKLQKEMKELNLPSPEWAKNINDDEFLEIVKNLLKKQN